jgi:hypothetical protein
MHAAATARWASQSVTEQDQVPGWAPVEYELRTSDGTGKSGDVLWKVRLFAKGSLLKRRVWCGDREWDPDGTITRHEGSTIWPAWPGAAKGPAATAATPLADVRDYWSDVGTRLRDSAKWTAAVLGAALATLIGTSPLSGMRKNTPSAAAIALGAAGLVLLGCTLFLVVQVMRPKSISFTDIQVSGTDAGRWGRRSPLRRWKETVESQQDLYLPCGVKCLTGLRQSMIVEEITLVALAYAINLAQDENDAITMLCHAREARAARLHELRDAAAQVAMIGEYYHLRYRSALATYGGVLSGLAGTAAVVAAFAWP